MSEGGKDKRKLRVGVGVAILATVLALSAVLCPVVVEPKCLRNHVGIVEKCKSDVFDV